LDQESLFVLDRVSLLSERKRDLSEGFLFYADVDALIDARAISSFNFSGHFFEAYV